MFLNKKIANDVASQSQTELITPKDIGKQMFFENNLDDCIININNSNDIYVFKNQEIPFLRKVGISSFKYNLVYNVNLQSQTNLLSSYHFITNNAAPKDIQIR